MDLWVVAAAAGAGYVAKYLQKSKEKEELVELVSEELSLKSNSRPFFEQFLENSCYNRKNDENMASSSGFGASEMASTSGFENESNEDYNVLALSSLSPRFTTNLLHSMENEEDRVKGNTEISDKGVLRSKNVFRSKNIRGRRVVKPLTSLDSCLMAQLYNEHVEMEEYVFSTFPSPSRSTARPLLVTDGSRIISRASSDLCSLQRNTYSGDSLYSDVKESVTGVPPLPEVVPLQLLKKLKQKRGKGLNGRPSVSSTKVSGKQLHSQGSPLPEKMFLFCLGITFGVLSMVMANKREVDKLNELLKQTKNLVQDLHEELEMKDSLTVDVLAHDVYDSQENETAETGHDILRTADPKVDVDLESRSKIEAELEAELEMLEQNMNASSLESRLSDLADLDPDSLADIIQGELRVDMVKGGVREETDSERNMSGASTTKPENVNYAVSPRELSIRLHEVIESRLEERISELETALDNTQKKLLSIESKQTKVWSTYSASEIGDSSSRDSPTRREEETSTPISQPLFLNLSDDALDAYNEAYEALNTNTQVQEEIPSFQEYKSNQFKDEINLWNPNEGEEADSAINEGFEIQYESTDDEDDDMMARLLIQQLVEKARQGSPVVLNAQRMLFSVDEN